MAPQSIIICVNNQSLEGFSSREFFTAVLRVKVGLYRCVPGQTVHGKDLGKRATLTAHGAT